MSGSARLAGEEGQKTGNVSISVFFLLKKPFLCFEKRESSLYDMFVLRTEYMYYALRRVPGVGNPPAWQPLGCSFE